MRVMTAFLEKRPAVVGYAKLAVDKEKIQNLKRFYFMHKSLARNQLPSQFDHLKTQRIQIPIGPSFSEYAWNFFRSNCSPKRLAGRFT